MSAKRMYVLCVATVVMACGIIVWTLNKKSDPIHVDDDGDCACEAAPCESSINPKCGKLHGGDDADNPSQIDDESTVVDHGAKATSAKLACLSVSDCDDGNPCTDDVCAVSGTKCLHFVDDSNTCTDGDSGTVDRCHAGRCVSAQIKK